MKTFGIANNQWTALNQKGSHKPQTDFAATLSKATSGKHDMSLLQLPKLKPLSEDDFAAGDPALPAQAARQLKTLNSQDLGGTPKVNLQPLASTDYVPGAKVTKDDPDSQVREQTEKWVAETFYGTLLKQMHDSPFKSKLFDGGRGAEAFEPMLDQQISDHIAHGTSNKMVDAVVNDIEAKMKKRGKPAASTQPPTIIPSVSNPYWNERTNVAPGIRA